MRIAGFAFYAKVHLIIGSYPQSAQDIALAKAMMPFAKTIVWPIEAKPNPNHRYFKGEGQRTIPLPTGAFNNLRPGEIINLADIVGGTDDAR